MPDRPRTRVVVVMNGGLVSHVISDAPVDVKTVDLDALDYDTDEVCYLTREDGGTDPVYIDDPSAYENLENIAEVELCLSVRELAWAVGEAEALERMDVAQVVADATTRVPEVLLQHLEETEGMMALLSDAQRAALMSALPEAARPRLLALFAPPTGRSRPGGR